MKNNRLTGGLCGSFGGRSHTDSEPLLTGHLPYETNLLLSAPVIETDVKEEIRGGGAGGGKGSKREWGL